MENSTIFTFTENDLRFVLYGQHLSSGNGHKDVLYPPYLPLPHQVAIARSTLPGAGFGVFATSQIKPGTEMGPYVGTILHHGDLDGLGDNTKTWEVFDKDGRVLYFLDGGTRNPASWLTFVQCARSELEQNLEVVQAGKDIYYRALRDIEPEEELLVWYGRSQNLYMGIPDPDMEEISSMKGNNKLVELERRSEGEESDTTTGKLRCVLCRRGFNSRNFVTDDSVNHRLYGIMFDYIQVRSHTDVRYVRIPTPSWPVYVRTNGAQDTGQTHHKASTWDSPWSKSTNLYAI